MKDDQKLSVNSYKKRVETQITTEPSNFSRYNPYKCDIFNRTIFSPKGIGVGFYDQQV